MAPTWAGPGLFLGLRSEVASFAIGPITESLHQDLNSRTVLVESKR